ncbi:deoxyribodipyrimidine photolyase family protein [Leptolyngbya boryana NIES-2135]|jgi:deoxyribodipyrimidine photo-lyase|uniref:Deoxyribodipyrimidine photolyase family protein n=1 Tax=Leptolyngbya boryana NIES-2135 TaxID=1973484 RepID=A0A1Z4JNJ8_LEPBY|nr:MULTISPECIES: deoxyribodipyrimidine photo-lyase [Leptolyngbya]BAY58208.1 deoxyribodipyrimidine photolyase family protein [Leptolyngbya boryana NIES-2135]MBD2369191.1 deoxyribodipyrimidine photo-lyase [Leptolyngbya sp. FACHB-161]MBD2375462.1 deoxyribodipyrimidine photo-lyase [Leptolyngbya sp. FACHB-238]MBD2400036.1 deoxyribodipyrimidine photo-lyase [Leptolyngbya sp. FACHB-239]MBD2406396.1 deoxyribodipyrimidine photo-lyase [Leptolyngbya sp. FACHB-402]
MNRTIVWFRRDLRISDHAPLHRAISRGAVIPVFIFDRALLHHPETGSARVAFMLDCLRSLDEDLRDRGGRLILRFGDPVELLPDLIRETGADGIYAYVDYERIYGRVRDARLNQALVEQGLKIRWFEPSGAASELMDYRDYRKLWYRDMSADMLSTPLNIPTPEDIASEPIPKLTDLGLVPDGKLIPPAGTSAARDILGQFLNEKLDRYYWQLSYPGAEVTSGLSPHIKFGAISIRECYQTAQHILKYTSDQRIERSCKQFISRLRWGSGFAQRFRYLPQLELRSLYSIFDQDGWEFDETLYEAWKTGQTGFPIIDAAARCLQATGGWMSLNFRSRALYSSFLSNLMNHDWRYGALHFMRHLIDGDCPIDHYQWAMQAGVTHCLDKSWTRIYNPEQAAVDRCDPDGAFIKKWVPELAKIPAVQLGLPPRVQGYPQPILNYREARARRVQQLEEQRSSFRQQSDILPHLARMPKSVLPFGSDRFESEIQWAQKSSPSLFPAALDLDQLDIERSTWLRSWLVAHVEFKPQKTTSRRKKSQPDPNVIQLSLLE